MPSKAEVCVGRRGTLCQRTEICEGSTSAGDCYNLDNLNAERNNQLQSTDNFTVDNSIPINIEALSQSLHDLPRNIPLELRTGRRLEVVRIARSPPC